jgi:hypothetical protein
MSHTRLPTATAARNPTASLSRRPMSVPRKQVNERSRDHARERREDLAPVHAAFITPQRQSAQENPTRKARPNPRAFSPQSICPQPNHSRDERAQLKSAARIFSLQRIVWVAGSNPAGITIHLGSRLCENSHVELARRNFVSITLNRNRTALAVIVERRKGRKQFCAFSARARRSGRFLSRPRTANRLER